MVTNAETDDNKTHGRAALPAPAAKFRLGQCVMTRGAQEAVTFDEAHALLHRHARGDWGTLDAEDRRANDSAVAYEGDPERQRRVLSIYEVRQKTLWVITEWDRSVTTILLPNEY